MNKPKKTKKAPAKVEAAEDSQSPVPMFDPFDFNGIKIEQYTDEDTIVIRGEIPGVDPEDIDVSVEGGRLRIQAERRSHTESTENGFRSEFRYGSFSRVATLPPGVEAEDLDATYIDGILEVRVPLREEQASTAKKIEVRRG